MALTVNFDKVEIGNNCCMSLKSLFGCDPLVKSMLRKVDENGICSFFKECPELVAGTVTIGRKWVGRLSAEQQYALIKKRIRAYLGYMNVEHKYYFIFEFQQNGQLHAHSIYYNMYQARHIEAFGDMGKRNSHPESFKMISDFNSYWNYIHKDQKEMYYKFPSITNIRKKDIANTVKVEPQLN